MLTNKVDMETDLLIEKEKVWKKLDKSKFPYYEADDTQINLKFPVLEYPQKVNSVSFDKLDNITGKLMGIKGQYLILDQGRVLNIRKHNGYKIRLLASLPAAGKVAISL